MASTSKVLYTAKAHVTGGRANGHGRTDDGALDVQLRRPVEMGGEGGGTNPEQLFAAGYAACFHSAMRFAVKDLGLPGSALQDSHLTARVHFLRGEPTDLGLAVELEFTAPNLDRDQAMAVMRKTHTICPYSRATAGNIDVELSVSP